jgi:signal peptidase I
MGSSTDKARKPGLMAELLDWTRFFLITAVIMLVPRTVLAQPFVIPSGSMEPTLAIGDRILVSKYAYGWSRHSVPFSPPLGHGRFMGHAPARGDIVVFKRPDDGRTDVIKRLVGLPGDRIQMRHGMLMINGKPVDQTPLALRIKTDHGDQVVVEETSEVLPNGRQYRIHGQGPRTAAANTSVYQVPEGCYFMMGDNRDNSLDSRFGPGPIQPGDARCGWDPDLDRNLPPMAGMGFVPAENLVGRAERVLFSWQAGRGPRWSRTFMTLRPELKPSAT